MKNVLGQDHCSHIPLALCSRKMWSNDLFIGTVGANIKLKFDSAKFISEDCRAHEGASLAMGFCTPESFFVNVQLSFDNAFASFEEMRLMH